MKIVFLNVWGNEMRDELIPYLEEQTVDTDIFCLQEATNNMKRKCSRALSGYKEISGYKYIDDDEYFSQSIFVRESIEVSSSGTLFADDQNIGLAVYVEIQHSGNHVYVCNAHGCSRPNEKIDNPNRLQFSKKLIEYFAEKEAAVVIGGDFNLENTSNSVGMFKKHGYRDLIRDFNITTTRNHLVWDRFPDNKMYYSDYVFINNKVELHSFAVEDNEVSDHLPMILQFEL